MWEKLVSLLGGNLFTGVTDLVKAFKLPPEQQIQFEQAMASVQATLQTTLAKIDADDRNSARQREMTVKDDTPRILAYSYTVGYFANLYLVWKYGVPADAHDMFLMLEGVLTAAQGAIMNYYFGSSHGSAKKDTFLTNGGHK